MLDAAEQERVCHCGARELRRRLCRIHLNEYDRVRYEKNRGDRPRARIDLRHATKTCLACRETKPVAEFFKRHKAKKIWLLGRMVGRV